MKEVSKSQVTIIQPSPDINEQNSHSDPLLGASLLSGMLLVALVAVLLLGARKFCRYLNTRESVPAGGLEPTKPSDFS